MRGSSAMKLLSVSCGGFLMSMPFAPVDAAKAFYDYRSDADRKNPLGCENPKGNKNRYLQIEVFDYNYAPWIQATWTQTSDECGLALKGEASSWTMEYFAGEDVPGESIYSAAVNDQKPDGGTFAYNTGRLQMDMYICAPWGNYELTITTKSSNGGQDMEKIAWEVEYGPDEYHTWDTLNTPFFNTRNNGGPGAKVPGYAPIPPDGKETTYTWPLDKAEGYYSLMYSGPFPPLTGKDCPNLLPSGVFYEGCYPGGQSGWTTADGPSGSKNGDDPAEPYRLFDGYDDNGVGEDGVMTLEKCKGICDGYTYFGLESAIKCVCGNSLSGGHEADCGLVDDELIPEHKYLCSGDSRVLCGTDNKVSVYLLDPDAPAPAPVPTPVPTGDYEWRGCAADLTTGTRVMPKGPIVGDTMSAEICYGLCAALPNFELEYFGTQYSFECFCAESLPDYVKFGHDQCTADCKNTPGETCGGTDALTVYQVGEDSPAPAPAPAPVPTPVPTGDYEWRGCAADLTTGTRVMPKGPIVGDTMSAEICYGLCAALPNFELEYFGTQYSFECFCAESLPDYVKFGHDQCTADCKNTPGETCGGTDALTVYQVGDVEPYTQPYTALECFFDNVNGYRIMENKVGDSSGVAMSAQTCYGLCVAEIPNSKFFGLQYSFECWCSEENFDPKMENPAPAEDCTAPCSQNASEDCGGTDRMFAYKINK